MFEFQTAISELTGTAGLERLAVRGAVVGRRRRATSRSSRPGRSPLRRLARRAPAQPRDARDLLAPASAPRSSRCRSRTAPPTPTRSRRRSTTTPPPCSCSSRTSSARSRTSRRSRRSRSAPARCWSCPVDALTLGVLRPPGDFGADIALGEGQPLGNRLDFGGPSFGFFAARERVHPPHARPDRRRDDRRRRAARLRARRSRRASSTSAARRRPRTSARARRSTRSPASVYLSWLGRQGIVELGELMAQRTAYARERLGAIDGVELLHAQPVVREFARAARRAGRRGAAPLRRARRERRLPARRATTPSTRTACWSRSPSARRARDIDLLADVLGEAVAAEREPERRCAHERPPTDGRRRTTPMQREPAVTIFEKSQPGPPRRRAAAGSTCPSARSRS